VPTTWLLKVTLAPLIVTPADDTKLGVTGPPPPPQELNIRAKAIQTPTKIAVSPRRR